MVYQLEAAYSPSSRAGSSTSTRAAEAYSPSTRGAVSPSTRAPSPLTCAQRFSSFVDLLGRLGREAPGERISREARACVDGWRSRLLVEKRHTRSKAPAVVTARVAMLQRMMDDLLAFPEVCESAAMASFLMG
jgi:hypothetical protein